MGRRELHSELVVPDGRTSVCQDDQGQIFRVSILTPDLW